MKRLLGALACMVTAVCLVQAAGGFKVEEKALGPWTPPERGAMGKGGHELYVASVGTQKAAVVDGIAGPAYDDVYWQLDASTDGRVAYKAKKDGKWIAVVAGQESRPYDDLRWGPWFSRGAQRLYYAAQKGQKWVVVIDGVEGPEYDAVGSPLFSRDGTRVVYPAKKGEKWVLVDGKQESKEYDHFMFLSVAMSDDGKHLAYAAATDGVSALVVDGVEKPWGAGSSRVELSPDGRRVASVVSVGGCFDENHKPIIRPIKPGGGGVVVVDGKPGKEYSWIWWEPYEGFSPDETAFGYVGKRDGKAFAVVNGEEGPGYDQVETGRMFSPKGHRSAYRARKGDAWVAVVDGVEGPEYEEVWGINWLAGGKHVWYQARKDHRAVEVLDGAEMPEIGSPLFSPEGERIGYWLTRDGEQSIVVDEKASAGYDEIDGPMLSPDRKTVAFAARKGNKWVMVVNGAEGPEYGEILPFTQVLNPDGSVEYRAVKGGQVYLVKQSPK